MFGYVLSSSVLQKYKKSEKKLLKTIFIKNKITQITDFNQQINKKTFLITKSAIDFIQFKGIHFSLLNLYCQLLIMITS